jgi:putative pyruvate formate lyase activating enzyme
LLAAGTAPGLVTPGMYDESATILRWISDELGPDTCVDMMARSYPADGGAFDSHQEINRLLVREENARAAELADQLGVRRLDGRSLASGLFLASQ